MRRSCQSDGTPTSLRISPAYRAGAEVHIGKLPVLLTNHFVESRTRGQVPRDERSVTIDRDGDEDGLVYLPPAQRHGELHPVAEELHPASARDHAGGDHDGCTEDEIDLLFVEVLVGCPPAMPR